MPKFKFECRNPNSEVNSKFSNVQNKMPKERIFAIVLIVLLGFACYLNALTSPFIWDDVGLVSNNYLVKDFRYLGRIFSTDLYDGKSEGQNFYRPIQALSYMLDYHLWGLKPFGYHLTNIILHILVAVLVYLFVSSIMPALPVGRYQVSSKTFAGRQFTRPTPKRGYPDSPFTIPLITALFWVVHPIHVEAVTYISGRADMLVALFLLLTLLLFTRGFYLFSLIPFACALLSKELALIFPFCLLLFVSGFKFLGAKDKAPKVFTYVPFFLLSAVYIYARFIILPNKTVFSQVKNIYINLLFFFKAIFLYLKTLILPLNLHMSYTVKLPSSILEAQVWLSILAVIATIFIIIKTYRRFRLFSFGLSWFFLFLVPHSGIFQINAYFAEHFCYLASIGIFLILAYLLVYLIRKRKTFAIFTLSLIIFYGFLTVQHNFIWQNPEEFYKRILKFSCGSYIVYNNLAAIMEKKGDYKTAEEYYLKAISVNPGYKHSWLNLIRVIYLSGKKDIAIKQIQDFLKENPRSFWGWANLGSMYANKAQYPEAIAAYRQSLKINPHIVNHHYFLGLIFEESGDSNSAIKALSSAIALDKKNPVYHNDLGLLYKNKGLFEKAVKEYLIALNLEPKNAKVNLNLGVVYALLQKFDKAGYYLLKAITLDNNSALAHYNLGVFYWQKKDYARAKEEFERALAINPGFGEAKLWRDKIVGPP